MLHQRITHRIQLDGAMIASTFFIDVLLQSVRERARARRGVGDSLRRIAPTIPTALVGAGTANRDDLSIPGRLRDVIRLDADDAASMDASQGRPVPSRPTFGSPLRLRQLALLTRK